MTNQKNNITKIYTVFFSSGFQNECRIYPAYHPNIKIVENKDTLEKLKDKCKEVEFIGEVEPVIAGDAIANIKEQREDLDGILVFGALTDELISFGLPTVAVHPLWGKWQVPFNAYKEGKVVTSCLPVIYDKDPAVFSSRIEDIAGKINLINTISKMKDLRVLVITDRPNLGYFEPMGLQIETSREEYEEVYLDNLEKTFGTLLVTVPQQDLFDKMQEADEQKANEITQKWIDEATGIRGTNEDEILRSARLYLAMKELMQQNNCDAITTEGYGWPGSFSKRNLFPSQGLPSSEFCTEGIVATSETLVDSLITQQLGLYITGSAGFSGDYILDFFNDIATIGHCEASFYPYRDGKKAPYVIRNLPLVKENTGGACVQIKYPINETVTVAKISMYKKKLSIFTGETVSGEELFPYWDDILCRTKLAIKTDGKALLENLSWETFGNHRVAFYGDYRQEFKDLAKMIGFEVIEKDGGNKG